MNDFVGGRVRIAFQQRRDAHNETRRAITALQRVPVQERLLHRGQFSVPRQSLNRRDFVALRLDGEFLAGINRQVVHQHRAGAAGRAVAAFLRAGQAGIIAQRVEQRHARLDHQIEFLAVDCQGHRHRAGADGFLRVGLFEFRRDGLHLGGGRRGRDRAEAFEKGAPRMRAKFFRLLYFSCDSNGDVQPFVILRRVHVKRQARIGHTTFDDGLEICLRKSLKFPAGVCFNNSKAVRGKITGCRRVAVEFRLANGVGVSRREIPAMRAACRIANGAGHPEQWPNLKSPVASRASSPRKQLR